MICPGESHKARLGLAIRGAVQGVGFRPFVFRLANELGLMGWVKNSAQGVFIEVEGSRAGLETFLLRVGQEKPARSFIQSLEPRWLRPQGYRGFEIRASDDSGPPLALVLPDIATCPECLQDILDPANRRHAYPFTNCTLCGPRFSIIHRLPYRPGEYVDARLPPVRGVPGRVQDPADRRFHAQPNACPKCGPQLALWIIPGV